MKKFVLRAACLVFVMYGSICSAKAQTKGLLWQITGKGIKQPTYLYGTIHLFDTSLYRIPQPVMAKLAQTKKVYFELDFGKLNPIELVQYAMVTDSTQYLNKLLDSASLHKLQEVAKTSPMMQMIGPAMYRLKPLFLTTLLLNNGKAVTIDMEMYNKAKTLHAQVGGLETVAEQMQALNAIPVTTQAKMMQDFLKTYTSADAMIKKLTELYVKQDTKMLLKEMNDDAPLDASFNEALLIKRNVVMINCMLPLFGKGSLMVAVGAGHLGSDEGLIALLRKKGYQLKSIPFVFTKAH
ncbi:TraB/GumN family protein [Mucilaginibacter sp. PAMB04168]|uniref:TraB/GumN family protein n=1 Tax=Mucilaginibacter sp. PAMB04168 TaxID=3138567 RepID=UPI0031F6AF88